MKSEFNQNESPFNEQTPEDRSESTASSEPLLQFMKIEQKT